MLLLIVIIILLLIVVVLFSSLLLFEEILLQIAKLKSSKLPTHMCARARDKDHLYRLYITHIRERERERGESE